MTIELNNKNVELAVNEFVNTIKNKEATAEMGAEAMKNMTEAFTADFMAKHKKEMQADLDNRVLNARGQGMTSKEKAFFNELGSKSGFDSEKLLPETLIERVFEDLVAQRPLLKEINITNAGIMTRVIRAESDKIAVWGNVFGEIKQQLETAFTEENITQSKLTAFVVVPDDLLQYGPKWVQRYVIAQINNAFAAALEKACILGDGKSQPYGLMMNVDENGVATEKKSSGTLTFSDPKKTVVELSKLMKELSVKENGKPASIGGKVVFVVNPADIWAVSAQYTNLNAQGQYVTALPFNVRIIDSEFMPAGKLVAFVNDRYQGYVGGGISIKQFDQTLALEDCLLYTAKQFAHGKADDNKAAVVFDLKIDEESIEEPVVKKAKG